MGSKTTETVVQSPTTQTQTVTPEVLPQQKELLDLQVQREKATIGPQTDLQLQGLDLISQVLAGGTLPGSLADISGGIGDIDFGSFGRIDPSEGVLGEEAIADISRKAVGDIQPFFQQQGIIDSGTNLEVSGSIAGDIRRQVAESNLQRQLAIREGNIGRDFAQNQFEASSQFSQEGFNIGNLFNLLNLGVGGQAQVQQPLLAQSSQLARSFAGLQPVTQTGAQSGGTTTGTNVGGFGSNPFLVALAGGVGGKL